MDIKLGDLFTIKSHPFKKDYFDILIGADATFTSPILVAIEVRNFNNQHNTDTGLKESRQVKGIFYSHKNHKYEQHWFKTEEIQLLESLDNKERYLVKDKDKHIKLLKEELQFKQVILKSVDVELNKKKANRESKNLEYPTIKQTAYLDFVPPQMHILDVRHREMKDNHFKNNGEKKTDFSSIEVKCKWYNPNISSFSEEWLPVDSLKGITLYSEGELNELVGKYFLYKYPDDFNMDIKHLKQTHSLIKAKQILFNHYKYQIVAEDVISKKLLFISIDEFNASKQGIDYEDVFEHILPNHTTKKFKIVDTDFSKYSFYEISYLSDRGQLTKRYIYIIDKVNIEEGEDKNTLLIAYCLLRNGDTRHFKVNNIKSSRNMKKEFVEKIFELLS